MAMIFAIVPPDSVPGTSSKSPLENILGVFEFQKGTALVAGKFVFPSNHSNTILFSGAYKVTAPCGLHNIVQP